jgi:hypothetical protein
MTGFLCALGSVWLPNRQSKHSVYLVVQQSNQEQTTATSPQTRAKQFMESTANTDLHYCPVTQFIGDLLKLLTCPNEKFGLQVILTIRK